MNKQEIEWKENMKMKDVFKDGLIKLPSWFNDSQKKYIVDALHCHDKLTEENASLREALTESNKSMKLAKVNLSYSGDSFAGEYRSILANRIESNNQLLKGDEDE